MTVVPAVTAVWTAATREEPFTPLWWTERLLGQLNERLPRIKRFNNYYRGAHPLPWLAPQASESFQRILEMTRTNYMGLVADATTERLEVLGFRLGPEPEATDDDEDAWAGDEEAWRIWQANNLDALSGDVFLEAVKTGQSYMLVAPNPKDDNTPRITIEHPSQVIVEYEPGDLTDRAAGLKVWVDDRVNEIHATLYLPNAIYKWKGGLNTPPRQWEPRRDPGDGDQWPIPNSFGVVPIVELRNNPQWIYDDRGLRYVGVSELEDVIDSQDRINKTIADRLMTQDFGAFPQKWANNWEDAEDPDEAGAIPLEGELAESAGEALPARTVDIGRDRLIVATGNTKFGQFAAAPLDPYSNAKTEDVKDIASRTRTPSQYLLGEIVNVSGEALQAAESGLVSKVKQRQRPFAEALEEIMRLALLINGDERAKDTAMELIWRDPEHRSVGALVDAIVKKRQVNLIPRHQALEDAGYTPQQIRRMERQFRAEQLEAALAASLAQPPAPAPGDQQQQGDQPPPEPGQRGPGRPPGNQPPPPQ